MVSNASLRVPRIWRLVVLATAVVAAVYLVGVVRSAAGADPWIRLGPAVTLGALLLAAPAHRWVYAIVAVAGMCLALHATLEISWMQIVATGALVLGYVLVTCFVLSRDPEWVAGRDDGLRAWGRFAAWGVIVMPALAGFVFGAIGHGFHDDDLVRAALNGGIASAVGNVTMVPLMVRWRKLLEYPQVPWVDVWLFLAFAAAAAGIFIQKELVWIFLFFPMLAVFAFRGGVPLVSLAFLILTVVVTLQTHAGFGPFSVEGTTRLQLDSTIQVFVLIMWASTFVVAGLLHDRERAAARVRAAGDALRESELRWQFALDGAGHGVLDWDVVSDRVIVSRGWQALYGDAATADGTTTSAALWDRMHPDDLVALQAEVARHLQGETPLFMIEGRKRNADGSWRWVMMRGQVVTRGPQGEPLRVVGTETDVTPMRAAEAALQHANEVLELAVQVGRVGIWEGDLVKDEMRFNSVEHEFYGRIVPRSAVPAGESMTFAQGFGDIHPEDREALIASWTKVIREGNHIAAKHRIVAADGSVRHLSSNGSIQRDERGVAVRAIGTSMDITENHALSHALMVQTHALELALQAGGVGFWQYDFERQQLIWDARMHELYRDSVGDFRADVAPGTWGGTMDELLAVLTPEDRASIIAQASALHPGGADSFSQELRIPLKSGGFRHLRSAARVSQWDNGRTLAIVGVDWDITAEQQLAASLTRAKQAADEANHAKSKFLANMSHEIRTPMNGVLGMVALALDTELTTEQRELIRTIQSSAESLLTVINDILDFSKVEAGKLAIQHVDFEVRAALADMLKPLMVRANERSLALVAEVAADVPERLVADWNRIRQVLVNLIDNALKFTPAGRVTVRLERVTQDGELRLGCRVIDSGVGITSEMRARMFEPFEQADNALTRRQSGTGLGLAISSRLVRLMGGELTFMTDLGRGTTFSFTLPVAVGSVESRAPTPAGPVETRSLTVLVAEDNAVNQRVTQLLLQRRGHRVRLADNGLQALVAIAEEPFDVVLMDIDMPELDGLATTMRIREDERVRGGHLPVVALTAHAMAGDRERFLAAGIDEYLTKPLRPEAIHDVLERIAKRT